MSAGALPYTRLSPGRPLTVLAYHDVPDGEGFRAQVRWLTTHMQPVPLLEGCTMAEQGRLPDRAVALTFDDGDPSVISNALPVLDEFNVTATLMVCPAFIDTEEPFWWEIVERASSCDLVIDNGRTLSVQAVKQLSEQDRRAYIGDLRSELERVWGGELRRRQMTAEEIMTWTRAGHGLGNHTWSHVLLDKCDEETRSIEIRHAHEWLIKRVGEMKVFAYPNGNYSSDAESILFDLGYRVTLLFDHRLHKSKCCYRMSRIRVNASDDLPEFKVKASGLHSGLRAAIETLSNVVSRGRVRTWVD